MKTTKRNRETQTDDETIDAINRELQWETESAKAKEYFDDESFNGGRNSDDEIIAHLALLSISEYERVRKSEAEQLGFRASVLDKLVDAKRLLLNPSEHGDSLQGKAVTLADVEPWPDTVNGGDVLNAIAETFSRYAALPDGASDALALWCAHAHCFKLFLCSPRLNISSPEKQCGKTTLRDVVAEFVPRPLLTENLTTAVLFRLVEPQSPVILADEYDSWITDNEELRGLLNAGHRRGATVYRCEGENNEVRGFAAYAPAVLCGIGVLPATLHDRSIVVRLERAKRGEIRARFDSRHTEVEQELCRKLARWIADQRSKIEASDPKMSDSLFNRLADNWRPLFAIAEIAGGDWPRRCAAALAKLTNRATDDVESLRILLLGDVQQIFLGAWPPLAEGEEASPVDRIFSRDLVDTLSDMKERPWPELLRGKPINERWLARNLAAFGIRPKLLRIGDGYRPARGYDKVDFEDAFIRYLPETGFLCVTPLQREGKRDFSKCYRNDFVTDEKTAPYRGECNTVTDKKREEPEMDELDPF